MDKRWIIIMTLAISIPIIIIIFAIISPVLSPTQTTLEDCNTLEFNDNEATNIVFFSEKSEATKYKEFFQETPPFNKHKPAFNFYYINSYTPKCELYKGIAILCHNKETIKKGASCPNDYLIVLDKQPSKIRSSAYENVISINTNHPLTVLTHEFGHAFANLAEEYTPARVPRGSNNCVQDCADFRYETEGCYEGCSQSNYFRSIPNGVMKTLSSNEFGTLNEALIIERIKDLSPKLATITGNAIKNPCNEQDYYLIEGQYKQGPDNQNSMQLLSRTAETGCPGDNGVGGFDYQLQTAEGTPLTESNFNPELIFTISETDGEVIESDQPFLLKIPKIPQGEQLSITESGNELINIRLNDIGTRACNV
jgi:hypothetical protein